MELPGGGPVMDAIKALGQRKVFTYGMTQNEPASAGATAGKPGDWKIFTPGNPNGVIVPFAYLSQHVPAPFVAEWNGGMGQGIHHKFLVTEFNGKNPRLFTSSS